MIKNKICAFLNVNGFFNLLGVLTFSLLIFNIYPTNAALSATTMNTIVGSKPYLADTDGNSISLNELLNLTISINDSESNISAEQSTTKNGPDIVLPENMKFNNLLIQVDEDNNPYYADGKEYTITKAIVADDDGDSAFNRGYINGSISATWYNNGVKVTNLDQIVPDCEGPYTLKIEVKNIEAMTEFGDPNSNLYGSSGATYTFTPYDQKICVAQPMSLKVLNGANSITSNVGYNKDVWIPGKGFSTNLMKEHNQTFPTTGFPTAQFNLIGSGSNQSKYKCDYVDPSDSQYITLSGSASTSIGENCTVKYEKQFNKNIKLDMKYTPDNNQTWRTIDTYTIAKPSKWGIVKGVQAFVDANTKLTQTTTGNFIAANVCLGNPSGTKISPVLAKQQFFAAVDMTNAPSTLLPWNGMLVPQENFSRDTDGTFSGEWGSLWTHESFNSYPAAIWVSNTLSATEQFYVHDTTGYVSTTIGTNSQYAITFCKILG